MSVVYGSGDQLFQSPLSQYIMQMELKLKKKKKLVSDRGRTRMSPLTLGPGHP